MNAQSARSGAAAIRLPRTGHAPADRLATIFFSHTSITALLCMMILLLVIAPAAMAQQNQPNARTTQWTDPADAEGAWLAVVTVDNIPVRCAAADTYYPFGSLKRDQMVVVTEVRHNWARIAAVGPAFDTFFGHVNYHESEAGRFQLSPDGGTIRALGRMDVLAPNVAQRSDPRESWRPIARLGVDDTLTVLETQRFNDRISHKVALPRQATGWVLAHQVRQATSQEQTQWKQLMQRRQQQGRTTATADASDTTSSTNAAASERTQQADAQAQAQARPTPSQPTATSERTTADRARDGQPDAQSSATRDRSTPVLPSPETDDLPVVTGRDMSTLVHADGTTTQQDAPPTSRAQTGTSATTGGGAKGIVDRKSPRDELRDLESAFEALQAEPIESAEVVPLRELYTDYATRVDADYPRMASFARARAEQLNIWRELQQRRRELTELRLRIEQQAEDVQIAQRAIYGAGNYTAVGRLTASTIYDGARLPRLFRLQDPATSRTVAYLEPDESFDLPGMLGQLIGIVGDSAYDASLRLNVVKPRRIDLLAPQDGAVRAISAAASDQP